MGEALGAGLEDVSGALFEHAERVAVAEAKDIDAAYRRRIQDELYQEGGFYDQRGRNAVDAEKKTRQQLEKIRKESLSKASPRARNLVGPRLEDQEIQELEAMRRFVFQERKRWEDSASASREESAAEDAITNWNDPGRYAENERIMRGEIVSRGQRDGLAPEEIREQVESAGSRVAAAAIARALQLDTASGLRLYEELKDKLEPEDEARLQRTIDDAKARDLAGKAIASSSDPVKQLEFVSRESNENVRADALRQVQAHQEAQRRAQDDREKASFEQMWADVARGAVDPDPTLIPPWITGEKYNQMKRHMENVAAARAPKDNPGAITRWNSMTDEEKAQQNIADWMGVLPETYQEKAKEITNAQKALSKGRKTTLGHLTRDEINTMIKANSPVRITGGKVPPDNQEKYNRFHSTVMNELQAMEAAGKHPSRDDVRRIIGQLRADIVVVERSFLGVELPDYELQRFELSPETPFEIEGVPSKHVLGLIQRLERAGVAVTPEEIRAEYVYMLENGLQP
jgi:hypothetical protein